MSVEVVSKHVLNGVWCHQHVSRAGVSSNPVKAHPYNEMHFRENIPLPVTETGTDHDTKQLQVKLRKLLCRQLFLGHYQERRYVGPLNEYRDLVVVNNMEVDFKKVLVTAREVCGTTTDSWIGITGPTTVGTPLGHCLWVNLHNQPFGQYWFKVKDVTVSLHEVRLRILCVRKVSTDLYMNAEPLHQREQEPSEPEEDQGYSKSPAPNPCIMATDRQMTNALELLTLVFTGISTMLVGFFTVVRFVGTFSLNMMHEMAYILHVVSPVLIALIDAVTKCFGGLLVLISMVAGARRPPPDTVVGTCQPSLRQGSNAPAQLVAR